MLASKTDENGSAIMSCGGKGVYKMVGEEKGKEKKKREDVKKRALTVPPTRLSGTTSL